MGVSFVVSLVMAVSCDTSCLSASISTFIPSFTGDGVTSSAFPVSITGVTVSVSDVSVRNDLGCNKAGSGACVMGCGSHRPQIVLRAAPHCRHSCPTFVFCVLSYLNEEKKHANVFYNVHLSSFIFCDRCYLRTEKYTEKRNFSILLCRFLLTTV